MKNHRKIMKLLVLFNLAACFLHIATCQHSICPNNPATGSDTGQRSRVLYFSPKTRRDVKITHSNGRWPTSSFKELIKSGFNLTLPTIFYLHAYQQFANSPWLSTVRSHYLRDIKSSKLEPYNLLIFDWASYSQRQYKTTASYVPHMGRIVGNFLEELATKHNYNMTNMHLMSYSISTHIAGLASRHLKESNLTPVSQITALDPTGVCFHGTDTKFSQNYGLRPTDAKLVVAEHYDMGFFGSRRAIGGLDVFVNGGKNQPTDIRNLNPLRYKRELNETSYNEDYDEDKMMFVGQNNPTHGVASHLRAVLHETGPEDDTCHDIAYSCQSYSAYLNGECADCGQDNSKCYYTNTLGNRRNGFLNRFSYPKGTQMYLKTNSLTPFCQHLYQVLIRVKDSKAMKLLRDGAVTVELPGFRNKLTINHENKVNNEFSGLLTSSQRYDTSKLESESQLSVSGNNLEAFSKAQIELNYMSDARLDKRIKASARLCLKSQQGHKSSGSLVKC